MTFLQNWLNGPRRQVPASIPRSPGLPGLWLRRPVMGRQDDMRTPIKGIDRLSLQQVQKVAAADLY